MTKDEIKRELLKCGRDPVYFLNTYAKIKHKTRGIVPFKTWDFQNDVIQAMIDNEFNIILKSRQLGISTVSAGYVAWLMLFNQAKMVMVIATKQEVSKNFVMKVKVMLNRLPPWFQQVSKIVVNNETSLRLSNESELKSSTTAEDAGRSEGLSLLIIDEAAHIDNFEEIWLSLKPTIDGGGRVVALSSPNGASGWFYNTYSKAEEKQNEFNAIKLMWDVHPDRDREWFEKQVRDESPRFIAQEYCCQFVGSGKTVIDGEKIIELGGNVVEPIYTSGENGEIWVFEDPVEGQEYFLTSDVSRGDSDDYSTFHIFKTDTFEQVVEYRDKIKSDEFAPVIYETAKMYNNAFVIVENNVYGDAVLNGLKKLEYENLYYQDKRSREYVPSYMARDNENVLAGFAIQTAKIREEIIAALEAGIRNDKAVIRSSRLINELQTFVWSSQGRAQAAKGKHDDLVIPLAIAFLLREKLFSGGESSINKERLNDALYFSKSTVKFNSAVVGMDNFDQNSVFKNVGVQQQVKTLGEKYKPLMIYKA